LSLPQRRGDPLVVSEDEHPRPETTLEKLTKLPAPFRSGGTVTAGNASGVNDGACALIVASAVAAGRHGLTPRARILGTASAGVEPRIMGVGPVNATRKVLQSTRLELSDMDVIELNEAFAAQALAVARDLDLPMDRTNPNGSGISLGHPIGATGTIVSVKAIHELQRTGGRYALVSMCIGGGQGIAAVFERM